MARAADDASLSDERLARAEAAFAAGDFRALRAALDALADVHTSEARGRVASWGRAVAPDPAFALVIASCALGLGAVLAYYLGG